MRHCKPGITRGHGLARLVVSASCVALLAAAAGCDAPGAAGRAGLSAAKTPAGAAPATQPPGQPAYVQGKTLFVETGVTAPDRTPTWYAPMVARPYAPVFEILATKGTRGRYYARTYAVTLKDIVKAHGHDCEGLTHAACCARLALDVLFPEKFVDRSLLRGISGGGPCWSDTTAYLTGARIQYGTLGFFKDRRYNHAILLQRTDTGTAVLATFKKGVNTIPGEPVMLGGRIAWQPKVDTQEIMALKKKTKIPTGTPKPYDVDRLRHLQFVHVNDILSHPLEESYQVKVLAGFRWDDWVDGAKQIAKPHPRGDVLQRNCPYRPRPISGPDD